MPANDPLAALVQLSNRIGQDPRLVQPGGGNTSVKLDDALLVKGSGTDLRTIGPDGFTRLSLTRLASLAEAESMSDAEMMRFMAGCMLAEGPVPSVETPLHSLLPHRVIVHTHDVATMSLTNVPDATAERLVEELFEGTIVYVPYSRPGFPLARAVGRMVGSIPERAVGLALAHHGLVVWGDDADEAERRLRQVVAKIDELIAARRRGRQPLGAVRTPAPAADERRRLAEIVLPAVRGALTPADTLPPYRPTAIPPASSSTTTTRPTSSPRWRRSVCPSWQGGGWRRRSISSARPPAGPARARPRRTARRAGGAGPEPDLIGATGVRAVPSPPRL